MDQLDILKKEWQAREQEFPKLTYNDIYPMLLKKSTSILKWIIVVSIGEILLWSLLSLLLPESSKDFYKSMNLEKALHIINILNYFVVALFIYLFWQNYKKIQVTSSVKFLMKHILKARRVVHIFIYYNIGITISILIGLNVYFYFNKEYLHDFFKNDSFYNALPAEVFVNSFFAAQFFVGITFVGLLILFYYLIYGLLLKQLKNNYNELKKIES